jgi:CheY-like chemotaxis protein
MTMPIFRGIHVLDFIKSAVIWRDVPVVMWTSSELTNDKETCRIFGADDYFTKPIDLDRYRQTLLTIFRKYVSPPRTEGT